MRDLDPRLVENPMQTKNKESWRVLQMTGTVLVVLGVAFQTSRIGWLYPGSTAVHDQRVSFYLLGVLCYLLD